MKESVPRELSEQDKLEVARMAQAGQLMDAIASYVFKKTGVRVENSYTDARYLSDVNEAVLFAWHCFNSDFAHGDDWPSFVEAYANGRPLTLPLLDGASVAYQTRVFAKPSAPESEPEQPAPISVSDFDEMDDDELAKTYKSVARAAARQR